MLFWNMVTGSLVLSLAVFAIAIWVILEIKKLKYKILAIFLIALVLFGYFSFNLALEGQNLDLTDFNGVAEASGIYFSWLNSAFGNAKTVTSMAIEKDNDENSQVK